MNFNDNQGLRKNATRKTMLLNEETYGKIDWSKVTIENNLARAGKLIDANLPVIELKLKFHTTNFDRYVLVNNLLSIVLFSKKDSPIPNNIK